MVGYLKRMSTFATYQQVEVVAWDAALASIYDDVSQFTVLGKEVEFSSAGDWFICGDFLGVVAEVSPEAGQTSLKCYEAATAFKRPIVPAAAGTYVEPWLKTAIETNFKAATDTAYAMPYLTVTVDSSTAFVGPDTEDGLFNIKSYLAKVRRVKSVFVEYEIGRASLGVSIKAKAIPTRNIFFSDGRHEIVGQSYSDSSVAKITAYQSGAGTDYYLMADGSITTTPGTATRAAGAWKTLVVDDGSDVLVSVTDAFAANSHSHKIEFRSAEKYNFYDNVAINKDGRVVNSYISSIRIDGGDARYLYKSGELKTTLSDKLKELI